MRRDRCASCRSAIEEAAAGLGGIDALVYSPGLGPLARLMDLDAATWRSAFDTNVVGAALVTAAALPHLAAAKGAAAYLSTVSASLTPPWPGLGAYAVTKAALDKLVEAWRSEHPNVGFTRVVVGDCGGGTGNSMTEFTRGWDGKLAGELIPTWMAAQPAERCAHGRRGAGAGRRRRAPLRRHREHSVGDDHAAPGELRRRAARDRRRLPDPDA